MLEAREDIERLLGYLKSPNPELQQNALKNLMFVNTNTSVSKFLEPGNIKLLIDLAGSCNLRVECAALRLLWHLSAQAEMKCTIYEGGAFWVVKKVLAKENVEDYLACSAVLQNVSEHRFMKGELNPNQVKLVNDGILDCLAQLITSDDKRVQFLSCLTVCNLAMNPENHKKVKKSELLDSVEHFVLDNQLHVDMVCHWLTLQPHVPLLHSTLSQVQLFSLSSLLILSKSETYKLEVWRCLSINDGVGILFTLSRSLDPIISKLADEVVSTLQLEEPIIKCSPCDVGTYLEKMFDNPEFSDVKFICNGGELYGHKVILASRCPQFHAMFTRFRESSQDEIVIPDETMDYATFRIVCEFIYTGHIVHGRITRANAVDVLVACDMWGLRELKEYCERFLWFYVDAENVAQLYRTAATHGAHQLLRVCSEFISRNFERVERTEAFEGLLKDEKEEIEKMVKESRRKGEEAKVDSQGKIAEKEINEEPGDVVVADGIEV